MCCPSAGCYVLLLFNVATVTVRFISLGAQRLLGCIFYAWNVTPRKRGLGVGMGVWGAGGVQSTSRAADLSVDACKFTPLCISTEQTWYSNCSLDQDFCSRAETSEGGSRVALRQWHLSSSDTSACSLLTPTAFFSPVLFHMKLWILVSLFLHNG